MNTQNKTKDANTVMAMIIASLIIVVSVFIALAYLHAPLETPNTPLKTKSYVQNCVNPDETINDFVNCLTKYNRLLADIPMQTKIKAVRHDYALLLVNGKGRSVSKYLIFDILNESEFEYNVIQIEVINKNDEGKEIWRRIFTVNDVKLGPNETSFVEIDAGEHLNNFEWSIIHLK